MKWTDSYRKRQNDRTGEIEVWTEKDGEGKD